MVDRGPLLTSAIIFYLSIGAAIFEVLEEPHWRSATDDYKRQKTELLKQFPCLGQEGLDKILQVPGWRPGGSRCRRAPRGGSGTGSGSGYGSRAGAVPGSPVRASGGPVPAGLGAAPRKAPSPGGPRSGRGGSPRFAASPAPRCSLRLLPHPGGLHRVLGGKGEAELLEPLLFGLDSYLFLFFFFFPPRTECSHCELSER